MNFFFYWCLITVVPISLPILSSAFPWVNCYSPKEEKNFLHLKEKWLLSKGYSIFIFYEQPCLAAIYSIIQSCVYLTFIKGIYAVSCSFLWVAFIKLKEYLSPIVSNRMLENIDRNKSLYHLLLSLVVKLFSLVLTQLPLV